MSPRARQVILAGNQPVPLPEGVTALDWALERVNFQNPRIRSFLGSIRLIEGVLESNYAILHCSPERLLDIWGKVRRVAHLIRAQLAPLLEVASRIPRLEEARQGAQMALSMLEIHVLRGLDRFPDDVAADQLMEVRKLLCVSIGQIHSFLHDTFGSLMAADPRSLHDADYFLSRRFPRDIEEAEWLHATLVRLGAYLAGLEGDRAARLTRPAGKIRRDEAVPGREPWEPTAAFLDVLLTGLTPKLKELLALRGIRFHEMEILDRHAFEIPHRCRLVLDLHSASLEAIEGIKMVVGPSQPEKEQGVRDLIRCHAAFGKQIARRLEEIDTVLRDLVAFVPLWVEAVEKRRALLLKRSLDEGQRDEGTPASTAAEDQLQPSQASERHFEAGSLLHEPRLLQDVGPPAHEEANLLPVARVAVATRQEKGSELGSRPLLSQGGLGENARVTRDDDPIALRGQPAKPSLIRSVDGELVPKMDY